MKVAVTYQMDHGRYWERKEARVTVGLSTVVNGVVLPNY